MCILLYVKLIWCSCITQIYGQLEEGGPWYLCIPLYVKLILCSGITQISVQLEEGGLGICAFFYMQNLFRVVVFHRSMVN